MGAFDATREFFGFGPSKTSLADMKLEEARLLSGESKAFVREGIASMLAYTMALEDRGWIRSDNFERQSDGALSFKAIKNASEQSRALVTGNPVMRRAALAKDAYIWGQGFRVTGADRILKLRKNKKAVFSKQAILELAQTRKADGNILLLLEGRQITRIPFAEIEGAVYDPDDSSAILYFYRKWTSQVIDLETQTSVPYENKRLYANLDYDRGGFPLPESLQGIAVHQGGVILHGAPNRLVGQAWGLPDILAGMFYAGEHKELIEAADAIYRAQSQYAIQYKTKTAKALASVAASIAGPAPLDPDTGAPLEYGQSVAYGENIDMQLTQKIGAGLDFSNFDAIAALAAVVLEIPIDVVLGKEVASDALPASTKLGMKNEQQWWTDLFMDIFEYMGAKEAKVYFPKIDPDPAHRQVQSIVGAAATKVISPEEVRGMFIDTFGMDADPNDLPEPSEWDDYLAKAAVNPGSTEPSTGPITPGQGQTGKLGKLADGDHQLRDEGGQAHTQK